MLDTMTLLYFFFPKLKKNHPKRKFVLPPPITCEGIRRPSGRARHLQRSKDTFLLSLSINGIIDMKNIIFLGIVITVAVHGK